MQTNTNSYDELSLWNLIKILFRKWWIILIALVVGVGAGALTGFLKNYNKTYYGTTVEFYVNPMKESNNASGLPVYGSYGENVTETMVVLLQSEYFAQEILNGISGVPEKEIDGKTNPAYFKLLKTVQSCLSFTNKDSSKPETVNQPNNIFYASIKVLNDYSFAQLLLDRLQDEAVKFIEENMPIPSGYETTKCIPISVVNQISKLDSGNAFHDIVKYGVLLGAVTTVIGCVVVLCLDRYQIKKSLTVNDKQNEQAE